MNLLPTATVSARRSWWYSATRLRTIPLWLGHFTVWANPTVSSMSGFSGPGVVRAALAKAPDANITEVADIIKKTAFKITRMGSVSWYRGWKASGRSLWYRRLVPGSYSGDRRFCRPYPGRNRLGKMRYSRHHRHPWQCSMTQSKKEA